MMGETTPEIILEGARKAEEAGSILGLPVVAAVVARPFADAVEDGLECPTFVLDPIVRPPFDVQPQRRTMGPLFVLN